MYFRSLLLVEPSLGWFEPFPKSLLVKKAGSNDGKKRKNWNYIQIKLMIFACICCLQSWHCSCIATNLLAAPVSARVSIVHACPQKVATYHGRTIAMRQGVSPSQMFSGWRKHGFLILSAWCHATCQENNPNDITQEAGDPVWDP